MAVVAVIASEAWLVIFVESDGAEGLVVERPVLRRVVCRFVSSHNNVRRPFSLSRQQDKSITWPITWR